MILAIVLPPLILESHAQSPAIPVPRQPSANHRPIRCADVNLCTSISPVAPLIEILPRRQRRCLRKNLVSQRHTSRSILPQFAVDPKMLGRHSSGTRSAYRALSSSFQTRPGAASDTFFMSAGNGGVVGKVLHDNKPAKDTWVWAETFGSANTNHGQRPISKNGTQSLATVLATWDSHADKHRHDNRRSPFHGSSLSMPRSSQRREL